jgi:hypothetical protein
VKLVKQVFELHNTIGEIIQFEGRKVLKLERAVGLYVDIGTIGYFRDLKVTRKTLTQAKGISGNVDKI